MTDPLPGPVKPGLFDLLDQHLDKVETGAFDSNTALKRESPLVVFCESFFQQLFENELGHEIFAIDDETKAASADIRIGLQDKGQETTHPLERLLLTFEELCDYWPDVLGFGYGGSSGEFRRFHRTYLPKLLKRIRDWAKKNNYAALEDVARQGEQRYAKLKGKL